MKIGLALSKTVISAPLDLPDHSKQVRRVTWIGLLVNLFLAVVKFIVGTLGNSQAVVADGFHSLSDMTTDIALLWGVGLWTAPADDDHPYGHWRIESIFTVLIGMVLIAVALGIAYRALTTIRELHISQPGWIATLGVLLSIILKESLFRWTARRGQTLKSAALTANAWHHRSDAISSIPALIAVVTASLNPNWALVDHLGALLVALIILKVSWDILAPAYAVLTDRGASKRDRENIISIARSIRGVKRIHAVRTRRYGSGFHVDLHVHVDGEISVHKGHNICRSVKRALLDNGPDVLDVVVHLEPDE